MQTEKATPIQALADELVDELAALSDLHRGVWHWPSIRRTAARFAQHVGVTAILRERMYAGMNEAANRAGMKPKAKRK